MYRITQKLLTAVCLIVLFALSGIILCQSAAWAPLHNFGVQFAESIPPLTQHLILCGVMIAIVIICALVVKELRGEVRITKKTEEGEMTIVESAISRYIRQVALEIDAVQSARPVIRNVRNGMVIDLYARVRVTETLPRIERAIRLRMRNALEETLGLGGIVSINVIIEGFDKVGGSRTFPIEESSAAEREEKSSLGGLTGASEKWGIPSSDAAKSDTADAEDSSRFGSGFQTEETDWKNGESESQAEMPGSESTEKNY